VKHPWGEGKSILYKWRHWFPRGQRSSGIRLSILSFKSLFLKNGSTECNQI